MTTDVQIANLALSRIGHDPVTAFSPTGNKAERWLSANYASIRRALLREFPWRFATKRAILLPDQFGNISGITKASPGIVTFAGGHAFATGETVYIDNVAGMKDINGKTYTAVVLSSTTMSLVDHQSNIAVNTTAFPTYLSGGQVFAYVPFEYRFRFIAPLDAIRIIRVNDWERDQWRYEDQYIHTNESEITIEYTYDVVNPNNFDAMFLDLLAARLSAEASFYLTGSQSTSAASWDVYSSKLQGASTMDSFQGTPRGIDADEWIDSRI